MAFIPPSLPGEVPPPSLDIDSDLYAAYVAFRAGNHASAARLWHSAAQRGDVRAANALGWAFDTGDGTGGQQPLAALTCYEFAAAGGWAAAQCNIAVHLLYGLGVPIDVNRGTELLLRSANQGQEVACELLAAYVRTGAWIRDAVEAEPDAILGWADRYVGVGGYLRETGIDYARFGADEVAQILDAAATRVTAEEGGGGLHAPAAA